MIPGDNNWINRILAIKKEDEFNELALEAFRFQYNRVPVYRSYCQLRSINESSVNHYRQIPFLPISLFKTHTIITENANAAMVFTSSGTTGENTSRHLVSDLQYYEASFLKGFRLFYGEPSQYCILALLPSYLERQGSSLVYMADKLIAESHHPLSGFYLNNYSELAKTLEKLVSAKTKLLLIGVTYALLNLAEKFPMPLPGSIIMETGGMKGQRREMVRDELHQILTTAFSVETIHSEYGMTELLSQGYSKGNGIFYTPPWMKILIRDSYDPYSLMPENRSGGINVIDLANINSCCFIETADLGKLYPDGGFTILGRFDNSDIRGCNLLT